MSVPSARNLLPTLTAAAAATASPQLHRRQRHPVTQSGTPVTRQVEPVAAAVVDDSDLEEDVFDRCATWLRDVAEATRKPDDVLPQMF